MILVLKGADFSANNLGKISISVDERTKTIMSKYGRQFSSEEAVAIQSFMNGLESSGILTKLSALYMPAFGSSVEDSFVNLATDTFAADTIENASGITFVDGGLVNDGTATNFAVTRPQGVEIRRKEAFQAVYVNSGSEIINQSVVLNTSNLYSPAMINYSITPNAIFEYTGGQIDVRAVTASDFTHRGFGQGKFGMCGINYREEDLTVNKAVFLGKSGWDRISVEFKKGTSVLSYSDLSAEQVLSEKTEMINMFAPCKMMVIGKSLTDEQLTKFYMLIDDVMSVFGIVE